MNRRNKIIAGGLVVAVAAGGLAFASQEYGEHRKMHRMFSPKAMLEQLDQNGDLSISLEELNVGIQKRFDEVDGNADGNVTKAEIIERIENLDGFGRVKRHSGRIADRVFSHADVNLDGKVEKAEVENRLAKVHSLVDWNDDGIVEVSEIRRLREGMGRGWRKHRWHSESGWHSESESE